MSTEVNTGRIKLQIDAMDKMAAHLGMAAENIESCRKWLVRQEMRDKDLLTAALSKEKEKVLTQRRKMNVLSDTLEEIIFQYNETEQAVLDYNLTSRLDGIIAAGVELGPLSDRLNALLNNSGSDQS